MLHECYISVHTVNYVGQTIIAYSDGSYPPKVQDLHRIILSRVLCCRILPPPSYLLCSTGFVLHTAGYDPSHCHLFIILLVGSN